jgi:hypothetical protein
MYLTPCKFWFILTRNEASLCALFPEYAPKPDQSNAQQHRQNARRQNQRPKNANPTRRQNSTQYPIPAQHKTASCASLCTEGGSGDEMQMQCAAGNLDDHLPSDTGR